MNTKEKIEMIDDFKDKFSLKNKKFSQDNLLTLYRALCINEEQMTKEQYNVIHDFVELAKEEKTLNSSIISKKDDIVEYLLSKKEIKLEDVRNVVSKKDIVILDDDQLNRLYEGLAEQDRTVKNEIVMSKKCVSYYDDQVFENAMDMYLQDGEDPEMVEALAESYADDFKQSAYDRVSYFLCDMVPDHFDYFDSFDIKEVTDEGEIIFTIKQKVKRLLGKSKFTDTNKIFNDSDYSVHTIID